MTALRPVRSFVLRQGRMSPAQVRACDELLPRYGVAVDRPLDWRQVFGRTAPVVLEIGFGRGVSAEIIQRAGVRSHTIVEANDHSVSHYFAPWRARRPDSAIRLLHARWQDIEGQLGLYDGIFFHAFPMNEQEFADYVLRSVTFAEHAFAPMASHLRDGGVFTYLTTEIDSLSRGHQRRLFQHFREISLHVESLRLPEDVKDMWWANSMVVVKAVK